MTVKEKKRVLNEYLKNMSTVGRLRLAMEKFEASASSIQKDIDSRLARAEEIEAFISGVGNIFQRELLLRKYVFGETFEEIGNALSYSSRQIQRAVDKAVNSLEVELIV